MGKHWTKADAEKAIGILGTHDVSEYQSAVGRIAEELGRPVTAAALKSALSRLGLDSPSAYCHRRKRTSPSKLEEQGALQRAVGIVERSRVAFGDMSPEQTAAFFKAIMASEGICPEPAESVEPEPKNTRSAFVSLAQTGISAGPDNDTDEAPTTVPSSRVSVVPPPASHVRPVTAERQALPKPDMTAADREDVAKLVKLVKTKPLSLFEACDRLNMPPQRVRDIVDISSRHGYNVKVADTHVVLAPAVNRLGVFDFGGHEPGRKVVGIISDLHFGSEWCLEREMGNFVRYAYDKGARFIVSPGDILDGNKPACIPEQTHVGFDRQAARAISTLPELDGLHYVVCGGNHDFHFSESIGFSAIKALAKSFKDAGRDDFHAVGDCAGLAKLAGARWHLWHPLGSGSTASGVAATLAKKIDSYGRSEFPDFQLCGHFHKFVTFNHRDVTAISCGTFQDEGSAFSQRMSGKSQIGGVVVSYDVAGDGSVQDVSVAFKSRSRLLNRCALALAPLRERVSP